MQVPLAAMPLLERGNALGWLLGIGLAVAAALGGANTSHNRHHVGYVGSELAVLEDFRPIGVNLQSVGDVIEADFHHRDANPTFECVRDANGRVDNGAQALTVGASAMASGVSRTWKGYWQRNAA